MIIVIILLYCNAIFYNLNLIDNKKLTLINSSDTNAVLIAGPDFILVISSRLLNCVSFLD